jgi:hypothetical protein
VHGAVLWFLLQFRACVVFSVVVLFAIKPHFHPCARTWCSSMVMPQSAFRIGCVV